MQNENKSNKLSRILLCSCENTAEDQDGGGELVEQFEAPVVNGDLVKFQEAAGPLAHSPKEFSHLGL